MFAAAFLAGERPREGSVANGTITGGDMPAGRVKSSSLSATDGVAGCGDRRSTMPDQSRGSVCAGRYGLRAGVAGLRRRESGGIGFCTVVLGTRVLVDAGAGAVVRTVSSAVAVLAVPIVISASEYRSIDAEVDAG